MPPEVAPHIQHHIRLKAVEDTVLLAAEEAFLLCILPLQSWLNRHIAVCVHEHSCLEACGPCALPSISRLCGVSAKSRNKSNTVRTKQEPPPLKDKKPHTSSKLKTLVAESKFLFPNLLCLQFGSELGLSLCRKDTETSQASDCPEWFLCRDAALVFHCSFSRITSVIPHTVES